MVRLTHTNRLPLIISAHLIEHIETTTETVLALTTGQRFVVCETAEQVIQQVIDLQRSVLRGIQAS